MDKDRKNNLTKVLIFSGDSHVKEYDANILKNEIKLTNTLQNITSLFNAQKPEIPTYNLQNPKSYSHFHVDLKNVKTVLIKNKNEDKCAIILYRDKTIKTKYRFTFLKQRNKMAFVRRYCNKNVKQQEQNCIKLYTNKKYLNEASSKRKIPKNLRNNTNSQYRLKQILQKQLLKEKDKLFSANAVFDIKKASQKVFLSRDIKNRTDIKKFVENIRKFNNTSLGEWQQKMADKLKSLSINLSNILIIIQINNFTSNTYLNMGRNTTRFKHVHKIEKKSFVNIKTLNIKLVNIKKLESKKRDLNKLSSASESNLVVKNSMDLLTDQLKGATFKEMCKMLLKLQCNSKLECKKLYSSYSAFKKVAFNEEIFDVVQKVVSKFSAITRAQQNANIEITNLRHTLKGAVKSFERVQSSTTKALILKKLESAIQEDDLLDPRILLPSDYTFFGNIVSKENISIQTEEEIEQQKEIEMIDFEVQHDVVDIIKSAESITHDNVYTIYTQTSQNSLNIMKQIASNISTQTAISIHKCTSIQFPGEHVQVRRNIIIHKIQNSLDQVKNMYAANNQIMKDIVNCSANISLTNVEIKSNTEIKKEEISKKKLIYEDIKKKNEAIINKVESMKMTVKDLKTKVDTDKNVVKELKDEADQMTVEDMKKKVDSVRLKVEDLKKQVDTQKIDCGIKELKKKEDEQPKEEVVEKEDEVLNIEGMIINQAKNKEDLINQIRNTLNSVTERFKQNSLLLAETAKMKEDYKVAKNVNKIMRQPLIGEESSASFKKALRQFDGSKHALNNSAYSDPQEEFSKNLNTSMKLLKNLNEITKKMKTQPKEVTKKLMEIKQALIAQRKHLAAVKKQSASKIKYNKTSITLSPIKNHIHKNIKNLVSLNAIRALSNNNPQQNSLSPPLPDTTPSLANLPDEYLPKNRPVGNTALDAKLGKIMPNVHSKHILKFHERKDKKRQLYATIGYHRNTNNKSSVTPVVQTIKDNPLIAKIVRPIRTTQGEEVVPRLSQLSFSCVQRFTPEYPRKDHIQHIIAPPVQDSYLFKLLNIETDSTSILEPLVKCSSKDCMSCVSNRPKTAPAAKIDLFDFKKYMYDPNLKHNVNFTVCPVDVTFNNKNSPKPRAPTKNVPSKKPSVTTQPKMARTSSPLLKKNIVREETQNKIQKNIQQAILKNQEKFMILHSYIVDRNSAKNAVKPPKSYNIVNINPKIVTSSSVNKKPNVNNSKPKKEQQLQVKTNNTYKPVNNHRPKNKAKTGNPNKKVSSVAFFDKKYGDKTSLSSLESRDIPCNDNNCYTQIELQNYITQVEQKFIHTFSMKEEEKANAYDNLTTEIEDMLDALKASGAKIPEVKLTDKKSEPTDKSESTTETLSQKERIVDNFLTQPVVIHSKQSKSLESTLSESNTSKNSVSAEWIDDSQAKKKIHKISGPTIITDHINFNESLTAIKSKENSIFHVHSTSNCQSIDPVPIIRNCKSDPKVSNTRKVRLNLSSLKVDNMSDESLMTSIVEEEELSMCNDVTTDESSANTLSFPEITTEFQVKVYFKTTVHFSYSCEMPKETYYTAIWQDVYITEQPQVNKIRPMTAAYIKKYDIDVNKSSNNNMSLKSDHSWDSIETIETLESDTSKDILNLPDSKFEIDAEYIEKYYSNLKLKELFTDTDESENTDEVITSNSPRILEILDMLTSLSKDDEVVVPKESKEEVYYKYNFYKPLISYPCYIYHETVLFDQVTIEMSYVNPFLDYSTALGFQSNQLQRLIDENHEKQNSFGGIRLPRFVSMPDYNLYSIASINSERKISSKHNLHDSKKSYSDTKFDLDEKFSTKRKMDSVCHNMFVNLQVNKKKRKINRLMKIAKRVVVNQITPLLKQTPKINDNFTFNLRPINTDISDVQKLALIFLYVTVFAFIFLCMTLNYSCE